MSDSSHLRDVRHSFRMDDAMAAPTARPAPEAKRTKTKIFKSGNSLAVRIPSGTGLEAGMEMELTIEDGVRLAYVPVDAPKRKIDVSKFAGKAPWLKELPRYDFEDSPRDWHLLDGLLEKK